METNQPSAAEPVVEEAEQHQQQAPAETQPPVESEPAPAESAETTAQPVK